MTLIEIYENIIHCDLNNLPVDLKPFLIIAAVAYFALTVLYLFIEFVKWIYKEMLQERKNCLNEIENCTFVDKKRGF